MLYIGTRRARRDERLAPFSNLSPSTSKTNSQKWKRYPKNIDEIANTAAQAELHAVHAKVEDANSELTLMRLEVKRLSDLVSFQADRIFQVASCIYDWFAFTSAF
jgi:hypothetical protein